MFTKPFTNILTKNFTTTTKRTLYIRFKQFTSANNAEAVNYMINNTVIGNESIYSKSSLYMDENRKYASKDLAKIAVHIIYNVATETTSIMCLVNKESDKEYFTNVFSVGFDKVIIK